jgi:two-component system, OmpR family, sensor kinase
MLNVSKPMIPKSIKWRLQLWYGLILVVVLTGFGVTAYQLERGRVLRKVDDELNLRLHLVAGALRPPPPEHGFGPPPDHFPDGQTERGGLEHVPPPASGKFQLPPWAEHFFGTNAGENFYFVVSREGKEIARGGEVPSRIVWAPFDGNYFNHVNRQPELKPARPVPVWTEDDFREIRDFSPSGDDIVIGRSLTPEIKELDRTALNLMAVGAAILLIGLAGGWWFVGRALRPIADISATAAGISAGDLSQRINIAETESELGRLAAVLNSTFARLETAFAQQRQFTADAAHELRTPVSVILTQTQTALNRERSATEYRETVEACQRAAQRMRRLTESLLELARLDAGQETLKRLKFDLARTAGDCAELVRPLAATRGITIRCDLAPVPANGDPERLAQVVTNLLTNAVQYGKANSEVRLSTKSQGSMILLAVSDNGPGISREDLPRVFERFYRADASRSSGQTGLGLAISQAIVKAHNGTIEVSSQPGVGTTFTVVLPG